MPMETTTSDDKRVIQRLIRQPRYSLPELGRYAGMSPQMVSGWLRGYRGSKSGPVVFGADEKNGFASFLDLAELHLVAELREQGLTPSRIREVAKDAIERISPDHPFAQGKFFLHGNELFYKETGAMVHLGEHGQIAFSEFVEELGKEFSFLDKIGPAHRYEPRSHPLVMLDPEYSFGSPVIKNTRLQTSTLYSMFIAEERRLDVVAEYFEVSQKVVSAAVAYEEDIRQAA